MANCHYPDIKIQKEMLIGSDWSTCERFENYVGPTLWDIMLEGGMVPEDLELLKHELMTRLDRSELGMECFRRWITIEDR